MALPDDALSLAQRACLLRAARHELTELHDRVAVADGSGNNETRESLLLEVRCLEDAIAWLWRYTLKGAKGIGP